jgi:hypothetical protein
MSTGNLPVRRRSQDATAAARRRDGVRNRLGDDELTGVMELVLAGHQRILLMR